MIIMADIANERKRKGNNNSNNTKMVDIVFSFLEQN